MNIPSNSSSIVSLDNRSGERNKEILTIADVLSNEKCLDRETVFQAIEEALAVVTAKNLPPQATIRVVIDRTTGGQRTFRSWNVVEGAVEHPDRELSLESARTLVAESVPGSSVEIEIESIPLGRIAAQSAKQVIARKMREAEQRKIVERYRNRIGELVVGTVKRAERGQIILDLGGEIDAVIPREGIIPGESPRRGDRLRGYLAKVDESAGKAKLNLSRTTPAFIAELMKLEIPEIGGGRIEIKAVARIPGERAKVAVSSQDPRLDPVGACIGMRGSRIQAVLNELAGERVDVVPWHENEVQFVINALAPGEVVSIVVDEDSHAMEVAVSDESLAKAVGRNGQNVKLAEQLTGWNLKVMSSREAEAKQAEEARKLAVYFSEQMGIDLAIADILVREGFTTLEELAYVPAQEIQELDGLDTNQVAVLQEKARSALVIREIASEEKLDESAPAEDLLALLGMDKSLAYKLAAVGIRTVEELAEQSTDELVDTAGLGREQAGKLIMMARRAWFI